MGAPLHMVCHKLIAETEQLGVRHAVDVRIALLRLYYVGFLQLQELDLAY